MNKQLLKKLTFILAVPVLLCSFVMMATDFSGSWKLNEGNSDLGQFGARGAARVIKVEQKADGVTFTKTSTGMDGNEATNTETLTFDGKASETTVFGTAKKKSTIKWSEDNQGLVVSSDIAIDRDGQPMTFKGTEKWSLSADGKTLTIQNTVVTGQGDFSTKAVYDKQ